MYRQGKTQHEELLKESICELREKGYVVIDLKGKSPSAVAAKNNKFYAIVLIGACRGNQGGWHDRDRKIKNINLSYQMFDSIIRIYYDKNTDNRSTCLNKTIEKYESDGYRVIPMNQKSPDALATKDNKIYAIEILGMEHRNQLHNRKNWTWKGKTASYSIFDGMMIKTFKYGESGCFTEKFGTPRSCIENYTNK